MALHSLLFVLFLSFYVVRYETKATWGTPSEVGISQGPTFVVFL